MPPKSAQPTPRMPTGLVARVLLVVLAFAVAGCEVRFPHAVGPDGARFVASKRGERYHTLDCGVGKKIRRRQLLYYRSGDDAYKDGFTPCQVCHPER